MHPLEAASIAPTFELLHGLVGMLLLVREENYVSIMLQQMGYNAETNARRSTGHNIDLVRTQLGFLDGILSDLIS